MNDPEPSTESWETLRATEEAERAVLLALEPRQAQARADVLRGELWQAAVAELPESVLSLGEESLP